MNENHAAEIFRALSVPSRMQILLLLKSSGPMPVKTIAETLDMTSPAVSQHLKVLRQAGLVQSERQGYFVPYSVDAHALSDCCGMMVRVCACPAHGDTADPAGRETESAALVREREALLHELERVEKELATLRGEEG
ncbi:MAG: metalloregulator ArsR/SmtB family transcription factor [Candidatus Bipolaricaulota bacterium]|nr:metalloregulator ArsR/SmtB family transcription factor [Candidatus Bipolaricaulota bacterium]